MLWPSGQTGQPGQPGQTGQTGQTSQRGLTGQRDLTFKLDIPGNLCRAPVAILAMFNLYSHRRLAARLLRKEKEKT